MCGHRVFPAWSSLGTSWTEWLNSESPIWKLWAPNSSHSLNYKYSLLMNLCYDTIKLLLELLGLLVFVVWDWCTNLDDCNVVWSNWNLDGDESAGDGSAADDTTCSFFPYSECHPILVFRVFSAPLGLAFLICGSFSKPCPSDLGKALDVPWIAF